MSVFNKIALGVSALSIAGSIILANITSSTQFTEGSSIIAGNQFLLPDSNTTTTPGLYLKDETTPIQTYPTDLGTEYCTGNTGALICNRTVKLTGSGGKANYNAGSFVCATSTCSILEARVFVESGSDALWGGWTTAPGTSSGGQVFNRLAPAISRGGSITGSASYIYGANKFQSKDVPPGSTFKFVWSIGNGTNDYSRTQAAAWIRYAKFYNP